MADIQTKLGEDLLVAVKNGDESRVVELLKNEALNVNYINVEGRFPLLLASFGGYEKIAQLLIDGGATVDTQGPLGMTALTVASERGHHNIVRLLGERGTNVEHIARNGLTPLLLASRNGHTETVEELLKLKANVILRTEHCVHSSLMLASEHGHRKVVEVLLPHFENVDKFKDSNGLTPLMMASAKGHERVAESLLRKGAQVNLRCKAGYNSLLFASYFGHHEVASVLLEHGALVDLRTLCAEGKSALIIASEHGHTKVVAVLLKNNAEVNLRRYRSQHTALMIACEKHHVDIVKLLLKPTADHRNVSGENSAVNIQQNKSPSKEKGGDQDASDPSETHENEEEMTGGDQSNNAPSEAHQNEEEMTGGEQGDNAPSETHQKAEDTPGEVCESQKPTYTTDVNSTDSRGHNALCFASENGDVEIVRMLIERGANVDPTFKNSQSPLLLAIRNGHDTVVEILLEKDANPNVFADDEIRRRHYDNVPPLIAATNLECVHIVELLLKHGAKVDVEFGNDMLVTPLMLAISAGHHKVTEMLVENGANVQYESRNTSNSRRITSSFTCVGLADACADSKIIQLLISESDTPPAKKMKMEDNNHWQAGIRDIHDVVRDEREHINPFRRELAVSELFPLSVVPQSILKHSPYTSGSQFQPLSAYHGDHVPASMRVINLYSNLSDILLEPQPVSSEKKKPDLCSDSKFSELPRVHEAFKVLHPVASDWMNIGLLLGIEHYTLKTINADQGKSMDCLRETIVEWLSRVNPSPTWEALADAVELFDCNLAEQIRQSPKN